MLYGAGLILPCLVFKDDLGEVQQLSQVTNLLFFVQHFSSATSTCGIGLLSKSSLLYVGRATYISSC